MSKNSDDKFSNDEFGVEGPAWADGKIINEAIFCEEFLSKHKIIFSGGSFFTTEGRVVDEIPLKRMVFDDLKICAVANVPQKISNIVELLKIEALDETFAPETDRIHLQNGTLYIDGTFDESKEEIVRSRLPVNYNPNAPVPKLWLSFLGELLHPEDIPTLQEFLGYCLIPSNKGQRMMVIKGNGGEGKSQIGAVMTTLFGSNMKDGSIGKISENRFARADLEHILLCIDDDLRMEGLKHTNYVKSIVTAQGKMDLEKKNKQSYQGYMYTNTVNKDIHYFSCSNYVKDTRGTCEARHYIRADALEQIVIYELKRLAIMLQQDEQLLAEILEKKTHKDFYDEKKFLEGELQKAIVRQQTVASLYEKLYEDNATGKVTDEWFTHMSHKYEVERAELKVRIFNLREKVANMQSVQHSKDMFICAVRKFLDMDTITAPLIHELIDHIDVYEAEGKGKNKTQRVVIHYNFVGYLEIPESDAPCFTADTRQGVAIGYIAKPTEKSA